MHQEPHSTEHHFLEDTSPAHREYVRTLDGVREENRKLKEQLVILEAHIK